MNEGLFFDRIRKPLFHGSMSTLQVSGFENLFDSFAKVPAYANVNFKSYALSTVFHETAEKMQPIEEYGKGRGCAYGHPAGPWHLIYDGRGDVQLTWLKNYQVATTRLHAAGMLALDLDLVKNPDLALRPDIAAAILCLGMRDGWFTGKKLSDYFNLTRCDPDGARRIINGVDCAKKISVYFRFFNAALLAAGASDSSGPAGVVK